MFESYQLLCYYFSLTNSALFFICSLEWNGLFLISEIGDFALRSRLPCEVVHQGITKSCEVKPTLQLLLRVYEMKDYYRKSSTQLKLDCLILEILGSHRIQMDSRLHGLHWRTLDSWSMTKHDIHDAPVASVVMN